MKNVYLWIALAAALVLPETSLAQTAVKQPQFVANQTWVDIGNGPLEVLPTGGNGLLFTRGSTGVGSTSGSSTTLTLTGTPTYPPCVGCVISGTGISAGTTVATFNGTTTITLSSAMTVASSTALAWGVACPTTGAPPVNASISPPLEMRTNTGLKGGAFPVYSYARMCAYGGSQAGVTILSFPIGTW